MAVLSLNQVAQGIILLNNTCWQSRLCSDWQPVETKLPCSLNINNNSPVSPVQSANNKIILNSVILHASWQSWMICATSLHYEFAKSEQDQTQSGFPIFVTENGWPRLDFSWKIWKIWTGLDTTRVSKFLMDNGWLRVDFLWPIYEI